MIIQQSKTKQNRTKRNTQNINPNTHTTTKIKKNKKCTAPWSFGSFRRLARYCYLLHTTQPPLHPPPKPPLPLPHPLDILATTCPPPPPSTRPLSNQTMLPPPSPSTPASDICGKVARGRRRRRRSKRCEEETVLM